MRGYDKLRTNFLQVLGMSFEEALGAAAYDRSRCHHSMVLHGPPTWTQIVPSDITVLDFNPATPDWLDASAASTNIALNFTTEDFSMVVWVNLGNVATNPFLFCRGLGTTDGWYFLFQDGNGNLVFTTSGGGASQTSGTGAGAVVNGVWRLVGMTRCDTSVRLFVNGIDRTDAPAAHADPVAANRDLNIGIYNDKATAPFGGKMWNPRIWRLRQLPADEMAEIFMFERHLFNV